MEEVPAAPDRAEEEPPTEEGPAVTDTPAAQGAAEEGPPEESEETVEGELVGDDPVVVVELPGEVPAAEGLLEVG